ncbi:MAG: hypothetical protein ACRYFK_17460 [Janthinobacterium lividum]
MSELGRVQAWIEAGKQVGKRASITEAGKVYWVCVGVQKWEGEYKLHFFKAEESQLIDLDYYDVEGTMRVTHFEEIARLLNALCPFKLVELTPLKGNKIF